LRNRNELIDIAQPAIRLFFFATGKTHRIMRNQDARPRRQLIEEEAQTLQLFRPDAAARIPEPAIGRARVHPYQPHRPNLLSERINVVADTLALLPARIIVLEKM